MGQDNRYLLRQRQTWFAVVEVPPSLRNRLGRRIKRTLATRDLYVARVRRWRAVADIKADIEAAGKGASGDPMTQEALAFREALSDPARLDQGHAPGTDWDDPEAAVVASETAPSTLLRDALKLRAEEIERRHGSPAAQGFYDLAAGITTPLATYMDPWLSEGTLSGRPLRQRTQTERRKAFEKLGDWMQRVKLPVTVEALDRRVAGRYVSEELAPGRDPRTTTKSIQSLRLHWDWLQKRGHLPEEARNPWAGQAPKKAAKAGGEMDEERPFTDAEIGRLLTNPPNETMADFIRVGALSGMRREEIGRLRVAHCADGVFIVVDGKTAASTRRVPIHSGLAPLVEARRRDKAGDAYLFHELRSKNPERTDPIGKAFIRHRRDLGIQEGTARRSRVNFHSLRRWFVTSAVNAKQPPHLVSLVVGHREGRKGMTLGRYWGGADDAALRTVVEAVQLPVGNVPSAAGGGSKAA